MFDTTIQYYSADIQKVKPIGTLTLHRLLCAIENPSDEIKTKFHLIRTTEDSKEKSRLKTELYAFTPAVIVKEKRCYADIIEFTGLMPIDYDGLTPEEALTIRQHLFDNCPYTLAVWLSPSGKGVRSFVKIPVVKSVDDFKSYFFGFEKSDYGSIKGFDISCQNPVLPMFLSYDPEIIVTDPRDVLTWSTKYVKPVITYQPTYKAYDESQKIHNIIAKKVNAITDNGHPQLRAAAFSLGGFIASGLIEYNNAIDLINSLIDSNHYLSTKHRTSDGYKKTAKEMIDKGIKQPLTL